ncbi:HAD family hydrolase [Owenweeksia hongkongensis]|uniref:HAD family hydrolase n=1 Tax=Owenweeksia hongkongensis TaxID=253245 RepID=UPI003A8DCD83
MDIKLAVLDMAGTTVRDNKEVETCFAESLVQAGLQISEERILAVQGWSKYFVFETLWAEVLGKDHPDYRKRVDENYALFKQILENHYKKYPAQPQPFAEETFQWLREKGVKIALTTGFYREITDVILAQLGWNKGLDDNHLANGQGIINCSLCSDDVENGRPAPDMIFLAMKKLGINDVKQVLKIGDTPSDLEAGKAAGAGVNLGILNGTHTKAQLQAIENTDLIEDLRGIKNYINNEVIV